MSGLNNSKPVIALDMDEVLYPFAKQIFSHYSQAQNEEVHHAALDDYHEFHKLWGINESQTLERIIDFFEMEDHHRALPINGSRRVLGRLSSDFRIIIVTARQYVTEHATRRWLSTHFEGLIDEVYFCNFFSIDGTPPISKSSVCQSEGASLFVDDTPNNVDQVASSGVHSLLFGNYSWNQLASSEHQRIEDWSALEDYINERF